MIVRVSLIAHPGDDLSQGKNLSLRDSPNRYDTGSVLSFAGSVNMFSWLLSSPFRAKAPFFNYWELATTSHVRMALNWLDF
jgi:hypothetical protein